MTVADKTDDMWDVIREGVEFEIHEMCQPLTTLRCRLELAMMQEDPETPGPEHLREAVTNGLDDMKRVFASVERLRLIVLSARNHT